MKNNELLNSLPQDAKIEALETLKYFTDCHIFIRNGKYEVSTGIAITSHYNINEKYLGRLKIDDVYTKEEQEKNYKEAWG